MAYAQKAWPEGTLPAILEQFLWVHTVSPDPIWPGPDTVTIVAIAKGPETVGDSGADIDALIGAGQQQAVNVLARATRETMYRQAEDAIAAAMEAGWALAEHPEIAMGGTVRYDRDTGVDVPCAECRVTLRFRRAVPDFPP